MLTNECTSAPFLICPPSCNGRSDRHINDPLIPSRDSHSPDRHVILSINSINSWTLSLALLTHYTYTWTSTIARSTYIPQVLTTLILKINSRYFFLFGIHLYDSSIILQISNVFVDSWEQNVSVTVTVCVTTTNYIPQPYHLKP